MISNPILKSATVAKDKNGISVSAETYGYVLPDQIIDMLARNTAFKLLSTKDTYAPTDNVIINAMTKAVKNV